MFQVVVMVLEILFSHYKHKQQPWSVRNPLGSLQMSAGLTGPLVKPK